MKKGIFLDIADILAGCALVAAGLDIFVVPNNYSAGGVSGLAIALAALCPLSVGTISLIINLPLLIAAWKVLGFRQLAKTLAATVMLSVMIDLFELFLPDYTGNPLLSAVFGGGLGGIGIGILFLRGISTGGSDLLSILLVRRMPNSPVGTLMLCIDTSVVLVNVLVFHDIEIALYSFVILFVQSKMIDAIMNGANYAKVIYTITEKGEEVNHVLNTQTERGSTRITGKGGFTGDSKEMIITVTNRNALAQTLKLIRQTDPDAFTFVVNSAEVHGEGFKRYRADITPEE